MKMLSYELVVRDDDVEDAIRALDNFTGENGIGVYNFGAEVRALTQAEIEEVASQVPGNILDVD